MYDGPKIAGLADPAGQHFHDTQRNDGFTAPGFDTRYVKTVGQLNIPLNHFTVKIRFITIDHFVDNGNSGVLE